MIYETIQDIARKRNVSIRQIELDLGFYNGTIKRWETTNTIPLSKVKAVAGYLHVDPYTLLLIGVDMDTVKED